MVPIKVVILTSDSYRHKYIANKIADFFHLPLVITEQKTPKIEDTSSLNDEDARFLQNHFLLREKSELDFFKHYLDFPKNSKHIKLEHGKINTPEVFEIIHAVQPDIILLFGTSIIKEPIINSFEGKIVNLHLGLSPYYKGSATNLFPIYYKEFEALGATIHLATPKVDDGPILHQIRPEITGNESIHDLGNKIIQKSGEVLPLVLKHYLDGSITGKNVNGDGRLCKVKDVTVQVTREIYRILESDALKQYKNVSHLKCAAKPIITSL